MQVRALAATAGLAAVAALAIWWPAAVAADTYVVAPGDTLGAIAARAGVSTSRLASLNGISDPNHIYPGQILSTNEPAKYTVRSGDTLSGIAAEHDTTWQVLAELNGLDDPRKLRVGQVLELP